MKIKKLLKILVLDSIGDLFKYNSFFILICFLILLDKGVEKIMPDRGKGLLSGDLTISLDKLGEFIFLKLPEFVLSLLKDYRFFILLAVLFLFKQLTSLWPSSDMRLMHRNERGSLGILFSLFSLKWQKILWDTIAVSTLAGMTLLWGGFSFLISNFFIFHYFFQIYFSEKLCTLWHVIFLQNSQFNTIPIMEHVLRNNGAHVAKSCSSCYINVANIEVM